MTDLPHLYLPRSPKPLLLLDQDGPLAGFDEHGYARFVENGWELDVKGVAHQTRRYITDHIIDEGHRRAARDMFEAEGWFRDLPVVEGAQDGVSDLLDAGVDIWVCTKPMEDSVTCASDKYAWIAKNFPDLAKRVIVTPNKGLVVGDVLLDDAPMPDWFPYACWKPVIYECSFNGEGSDWEGLDRWSWGKPIDILLGHLEDARAGQSKRPGAVVG